MLDEFDCHIEFNSNSSSRFDKSFNEDTIKMIEYRCIWIDKKYSNYKVSTNFENFSRINY